jgi:hypothetical protein
MDRAALERLCARHGIAPDYHDIWGARHVVPDASLVALLGALGVEAGSDEAVAAAERAPPARGLPPAHAIAADDAGWSLPWPEAARWTIDAEDGARHEGHGTPGGIALPAGYHRLRVDGAAGQTLLIAAPPRCTACGPRTTGASATSATCCAWSSSGAGAAPASSGSIRCTPSSRTTRRT